MHRPVLIPKNPGRNLPHPFPYQGSKRRLASLILQFVPSGTRRLIEPFAGSAAVSIAVAASQRVEKFLISDVHAPLTELWKTILERPDELARKYARLWHDQAGRDRVFYDEVRERFNRLHQPPDFLYLLARCVKAAIRYNSKGEFNNSPDKRRRGMRPDNMRRNIQGVAQLLADRATIRCETYQTALRRADSTDVVYMDPPYQGVCDTHNHRYLRGIDFTEFVEELEKLNRRSIAYLISYDGRTGDKTYGPPLPKELRLEHHEIRAGRSTQATLLGRAEETYESIYLSPSLTERLANEAALLSKSTTRRQRRLFN